MITIYNFFSFLIYSSSKYIFVLLYIFIIERKEKRQPQKKVKNLNKKIKGNKNNEIVFNLINNYI